MRVAIVHYWLVGMRGGERVLERLLKLYPGADIFTHVYDPAAVSELIRSHTVKTTSIQSLPFARKFYQRYLPFMPRALESLDLSAYDLIISSESGPAKGVIPRPDAAHVCYCHTPMRYLWDHFTAYRASAGFLAKKVMDWTFPKLRLWDVASAQRVDAFAANSNFVRQRIQKYYRRDAEIIPPPVDVSRYAPVNDISGEYLWVGQLISYKRPDIAVEAFTRLGLPLHVVGSGPMEAALRRKAGPTIRFSRKLPYPDLIKAYARTRALVFTAEEDFGIVPVEALASGRPVIAFGRGGILDTVTDRETGIFFHEQSAEAVAEAVGTFDAWLPQFNPDTAVRKAAQFSPEAFDAAFTALVERTMADVRQTAVAA